MNHDLVISQTITINAPVSKVWVALTNPEIIKLYLYGTQTTTDWKVGSSVVFQGEYQGQTYKDKGIVKENRENELLSYSYWSGFSGAPDVPENYSLVTYILKSIDANTTVFTWDQKGWATQEGYEHSKTGMNDFLASIKKIVEEM
jgi:uncharacterized protein YndB with AHSA1/START domain